MHPLQPFTPLLMPFGQKKPHRLHPAPRLFWWMTLGLALFAMVPTVWTSVDVRAAGIFFEPQKLREAAGWWWVELINLYIPLLFRWTVFLSSALLALSFVWKRLVPLRFVLAFLALAITTGPGIVVNGVFKDNWQRARPYQVTEFGGTQQFTRAAVMTDQCDNNCSFVSGHVACGFFLMSIMLLQPGYRRQWAAAGAVCGLLIGFSRMADTAHWLSDVLWAGPITMLTSWLVWQALLRIPKLH
jgi:lipid A 4'-phosphatase